MQLIPGSFDTCAACSLVNAQTDDLHDETNKVYVQTLSLALHLPTLCSVHNNQTVPVFLSAYAPHEHVNSSTHRAKRNGKT